MTFKEELHAKFVNAQETKVKLIADPLFERIKAQCVQAAEDAREELEFYLKDNSASSSVGHYLEKRIKNELNLDAVFHIDSDRRDTTYIIRIKGWTR